MEDTHSNRKKRARVSTPKGRDLIRVLPEEILVSILSRLTLREAVRTSVLSKRWRYQWTCISVLNFDAKANKLSSHRSEYIERVSSVLAQHRGPNVEEFRVCYNLHKAYSSHIDEWIEFALSNRAHTIELNLSNSRSWRSRRRCYTLQREVMGLGPALGFKSLKTLSLKAVNVGDEVMEYFLSNCPLLERLFVHLNYALKNLKLVGPSLLLRHLEVVRCLSIEAIEICDTKLVSFTYDGIPPKILLKNAPQLVQVSINPNGAMWYVQDMFPKFSCCFSRLEILELKILVRRPAPLSDIILPELENLKQFVLVVKRWYTDSLLGYLAMMKNWPNLQRFVLQLSSRRNHRHDELRLAATENLREAARYCQPCLKVVEIAGYCNTCDFELFKQIIENAVALEKIIIDTLDDRKPDSYNEGQEDYGELQIRCAEEQLRTQVLEWLRTEVKEELRTHVSPGVELVVL